MGAGGKKNRPELARPKKGGHKKNNKKGGKRKKRRKTLRKGNKPGEGLDLTKKKRTREPGGWGDNLVWTPRTSTVWGGENRGQIGDKKPNKKGAGG